MAFDSKEYTRLRDIAQKRIKRAAAQGIAPAVHVPTVREIRSGIVDPGQAMRELKRFISGGSTVTAIKQTGLVPEFREFPQLPPKRKMTTEEQKARKRERDRLYRMRKAIEKEAVSSVQAKKHASYLKALQTISRQYKRMGRDLGIDLASMTPSEAAAFAAYMDYRFAQGDFTQMYVIDEFIQDFSKLRSKGHKPGEIVNDFNIFLAHQAEVKNRADNMEGLSSDFVLQSWFRFVGD